MAGVSLNTKLGVYRLKLLDKLTDLELAAEKFGLRWENISQIIDQIKSELDEVNEHIDVSQNINNKSAFQNEIGDLLHATFSLCVFCGFSPQETLAKAINKFEKRFEAIKQHANENGLSDLNDHTFEELMAYWAHAKQKVG